MKRAVAAASKPARKSLFEMLTHPDRPVMRTLTLLGGLAGAVGLVATTMSLTSPSQEATRSDTDVVSINRTAPPKAGSNSQPAPLQEVYALATGVQLGKFVELLGEPDRKREVLNSDYENSVDFAESIWERPSYILQAVTDRQDTVVAYTLTTMDAKFHPEIPFKLGRDGSSIRLGVNTFSDLETDPVALDAVYPANARYIYSEMHGDSGAFHYRTLLLTQSWDATGISPFDSASGEDSVFDDFNAVSRTCSNFAPCVDLPPDTGESLKRLRKVLVISGFTITDPDFDIRSIALVPNPDILDSRCELPVGCN